MMHSVFTKTLYDKRWFVLGWLLGFVAMTVLLASFYPAVSRSGNVDSLLAGIPQALRGLIGNLADLQAFPTYMASQLFDIRIPLLAGVMSIILALSLSTSEEERGELRSLLALPVSRRRLLVEKWFGLIVVMAACTSGIALGLYISTIITAGASISLAQASRLMLMTWLIMVALGSMTFAIGMISGKRAVANTIAIVVVVGSFLISTFGKAVDWVGTIAYLSVFHYFPAVQVVKSGIDTFDITVLLAISLLSTVIALAVFCRRDVS